MKRDLYIDFAKGFATLSIIFIHTVYWSGQFYVPTEVRVLSLLIDVPLFYALSGLTSGSNVEKTLYRLLKLQITYMIFVTFLFFLDYFFKVFGLNIFGLNWMKDFYSTFGSKYVPLNISDVPQWQNLGNWYLHQYTNADTFPVVMGSFWYLKVYFILTVFGVLILRFFSKHINWFIGLCFGLTFLFNILPQFYPTGQVGYVALYLGVFLIAHQLKGKEIPTKWVPFLYGIFELLGGVYLLYLAYKIWKHSGESLSMDMKLEKSSKGFFKAMLFGFITQISNPKTAIIIGSIFAALLPKELPAYSELLLCLIAFSIDAIWYSMVVFLLSTKKSQKIYLRFKKYIDRVAGTLLAALGIKIALDYQ